MISPAPVRPSAPPTRRALITYALVSDSLEKHNDFLLGLVPLFAEIASSNTGKIFDASEFSQQLKSFFGIEVHPDVCQVFAPRLQVHGFLERLTAAKHEIAYKWTDASTGLGVSQEDAESQIELLISRFRQYIKNFPGHLPIEYTNDEIEEIIFEGLIEGNKGLQQAMSFLNGGNHSSSSRVDIKYRSEGQYVLARFLTDLERTDQKLFELAGQISNASIVSEVVIELNEPSVSVAGADLTLYLDAPFVMDILELSGKARKEFAAEVMSAIRAMRVNAVVFAHSIKEIEDNLKSVLETDEVRRYGPTATAMKRQEVTEAYVKYVYRSLDERVAEAAIQVLDVRSAPPPITARSFFADRDRQALFSKLNSSYNNIGALDRDLDSVQYVVQRRGSTRTSNVLKTKHLFATNNALLVQVTNRFLREEKGLDSRYIGPIYHSHKLAAAVWLAAGTNKKLAISRRQLVARCSRALMFKPEVFNQIKRRLSEISPEKAQQFSAMISEPRFMQMAFDFAFGSEAVATTSDVQRLLNSLEEELVRGIKEVSNKKIKEISQMQRETKENFEEKMRIMQNSVEGAAAREREARIALLKPAEEIVRNQVALPRKIQSNMRILYLVAALLSAGFGAFFQGQTFDGHALEAAARWLPFGVSAVALLLAMWRIDRAWMDEKLYQWGLRRAQKALERGQLDLLLPYFDLHRRTWATEWLGLYNSAELGRSPKMAGELNNGQDMKPSLFNTKTGSLD